MAQPPSTFHSDQQKDDGLIAFNLLLLLGSPGLPFPTALLAEHLLGSHADQKVAAVVYSGSFLALAIVFNVMWHYAIRARIVTDDVNVGAITKQYSLGRYCTACWSGSHFSTLSGV